MKVLLYKGKSLVSWLIKLQTRSEYSHAAVMLRDGTVIEAWKDGVRHIPDPFEGHTTGTPVDVFRITENFDEEKAETYLRGRTGNKYDFKSVFRFLSRRDAPLNDKDFCSELLLMAFSEGELDLLRGNPSHMSPRDVGISPYIAFEKALEDPR